MRFETISFVTIFLPIMLILYYSASRFLRIQNVILLLGSMLFYYIGTMHRFSFIILLSCIVWNWLAGIYIEYESNKGKNAKLALIISISGNVLLLFVCRLLDLFPSITNQLFNNWLLPLGISWFILQGIGYCIEVFLKEVSAEKNIFTIAFYLLFFPKIAYGPLIDFSMMKQQINKRIFQLKIFEEGSQRFIIGLAKKVLIADQFSYFLNYAFVQSSLDNAVTQSSVLLMWFALLVNGMFYYFTLSGYADMAIGLAKMFGFILPENFSSPFVATSLTEFWKRWNMTVIRWFRKYFSNLVNLNKNRDQIIVNLLIVWLLIGLWQGLGWQFVLWGAFNFVVLIVEHFFYFNEIKSHLILRRFYTILLVFLGFIFLRTESLYHVGQFFGDLLGLNNNGFYDARVFAFLKELWLPFLAASYIMFVHPIIKDRIATNNIVRVGSTIGIIFLYVLCLLFMLLGFQLDQLFG